MDKGFKNLLLFFIPLFLFFIIILYIYASFVTGDELYFLHPFKYISTNSTKWAEFGTLLSGLFTLLGSLATIMTMAFLLKQNKDNLERIDKQLAQAEETYRAGVDFNNFQQEQMMFDKFKLHREMFKEMLEQFEEDEGNDILISSKMELYADIFHLNSFTNCETGVSLSSNTDPQSIFSKLCIIVDKRNLILNRVRNGFYLSNPLLLLNDIYEFNSLVGISWDRDVKSGDVILYGQTIVLNVLDVKRSILLVDFITLKLVSFSHSGTLIQESIKFNPSKITMALIGYLRQMPLVKQRVAAFPYSWSSVERNVILSFELYKKLISFHVKKTEINKSIEYVEHFLGFYPNLSKLDEKYEFTSFMFSLSKNLQQDFIKNPSIKLNGEFNDIFSQIRGKVRDYYNK